MFCVKKLVDVKKITDRTLPDMKTKNKRRLEKMGETFT